MAATEPLGTQLPAAEDRESTASSEVTAEVIGAKLEALQKELDNLTNPATTRYCSNCDMEVPPQGKGHCPLCGCFLQSNLVGFVHGGRQKLTPAEDTSRQDLLDQLYAEHGGREAIPLYKQFLLQDLATAVVQRDKVGKRFVEVGALTAGGARRAVLDVWVTLSARVERLSADIGPPLSNRPIARQPLPGIERMPIDACALASELIARLRQGIPLTEREQGQLDILRSAARGEVDLGEPPEESPPLESCPPEKVGQGFEQPSTISLDLQTAPVAPPTPIVPTPSSIGSEKEPIGIGTPIVWTADYAQRITPSLVQATLGYPPTGYQDYLATRNVLAARTATNPANDSLLNHLRFR
jgi:hypothetical protein